MYRTSRSSDLKVRDPEFSLPVRLLSFQKMDEDEPEALWNVGEHGREIMQRSVPFESTGSNLAGMSFFGYPRFHADDTLYHQLDDLPPEMRSGEQYCVDANRPGIENTTAYKQLIGNEKLPTSVINAAGGRKLALKAFVCYECDCSPLHDIGCQFICVHDDDPTHHRTVAPNVGIQIPCVPAWSSREGNERTPVEPIRDSKCC